MRFTISPIRHLSLYLFGVVLFIPNVVIGEQQIQLNEPRFTRMDSGQYQISVTVENEDWNSTLSLYPSLTYRTERVEQPNSLTVPLGNPLSLYRGTSQKLTSVVSLPQSLTGAASVSFELRDSLGSLIATTTLAEDVALSERPSFISLASCTYGTYPVYSGASFILLIGTNPEKFACNISNGTPITQEVQVKMEVYAYEVFGEKIALQENSFTLAPAETKPFTLDFPEEIVDIPGNHTLAITLVNKDGAQVSLPLLWKLDVPGAAADITHLRLDQPEYAAGKTARVEYLGNIRPASYEKIDTYTLDISLKDSNDQLCTKTPAKFSYDPSNQIKTLDVSIDTPCNEPTILLNVYGSMGNRVLSKTVSTALSPPESDPRLTQNKNGLWIISWGIGIFVALVTAVISFLWWRKKQKNTPPPVMPSNM